MKTIVILLAISLVAVMGEHTDEERRKFKEIKDACITDSGVDPDLIERAKNGEEINDEKLDCFGTCLLKKFGTLSETGEVDWDNVKAKMAERKVPQDKIDELYNKCKDVTGTGCQKGSNLWKCFKQFHHDHNDHDE